MPCCQVGWQGASDFLIRNERLAARGLLTFDFGMDYLEEGSSGKAQMRHYRCRVGIQGPATPCTDLAQAVGVMWKDQGSWEWCRRS